MADSFPELYKLNRDAFAARGQNLSPQGYRDLFKKNINQSLKARFKDARELKRLMDFKARLFGKYYDKVKLFPIAKPLVRLLAARYPLAVVSSTRRRHVDRILRRHGLRQHFKAVLGSEAETKEREIRRVLGKLQANPKKSFFITDTEGDVRIARKLGLKPLAVTWGFHTVTQLKKAKPHRIFYNWRNIGDTILNSI